MANTRNSCSLFDKGLIEAINIPLDQSKDIAGSIQWLASKIDKNALKTPTNSGIWKPIYIKNDDIGSYGSLLSRAKPTSVGILTPCNCVGQLGSNRNTTATTLGTVFYTDLEDPENGISCSYCSSPTMNPTGTTCIPAVYYNPKNIQGGLPSIILGWPPQGSPPAGNNQPISIPCCKGGCDTRMKTDDITPKIPYLYNNYIDKFYDFKYLEQFPSIENPGLGKEKFFSYLPEDIKERGLEIDGSSYMAVDWIIKARMGEIPDDKLDTYHSNHYIHKKSYSRFQKNNKTAGNFILQKLNTVGFRDNDPPVAAFSENNPNLTGGPVVNYADQFDSWATMGGYLNNIPKPEVWTVPYGITDKTHYNIFGSNPNYKLGSYWKWNISKAVLCWARVWDLERENDSRPIPGVDLYMSDGDVFWAKNDGPEPIPISGAQADCKPRTCPSGLKLLDYQTDAANSVAIIPSGSEFLYISSNIYQRAYDILQNKIMNGAGTIVTDKSLRQWLQSSAIEATGPVYDGITTRISKRTDTDELGQKFISEQMVWGSDRYSEKATKEFKEIVAGKRGLGMATDPATLASLGWPGILPLTEAELNSTASEGDIWPLGESSYLKKLLTEKDMFSYGLNMIHTTGDLIDMLINKYGLYLYLPKKTTSTITITKQTIPHAYIDLDFEPIVKIADVKRNRLPPAKAKMDCNTEAKSRTKFFSYDQYFEIGESNLRTSLFNETRRYNSQCIGDPAINVPVDFSDVAGIYFNDKPIALYPYGAPVTSITDIYSRYPSVSSTLDDTFESISSYEDPEGDEGVYSLVEDKMLIETRHYNAYAANVGVDLAAFHIDGGVYYDSPILTSENIGTVAFINGYRPDKKTKQDTIIKFTTNDLAIKLYSISIKRLRDKKHMDCPTMPLDQSCSCWGIPRAANFPYVCGTEGESVTYTSSDLYTPFLSNKEAPQKAYGGKTEAMVTKDLGTFRIPDHPAVGSLLPTIVKYNDDILNMNGCKKDATITLPNYVYTKWKIEIPSFDPDQATLWMTVSDTLASNRNSRSANRVVVNGGTPVYHGQQERIQSSSKVLDIEIYNEALVAAFKEPEKQIYDTALMGCSAENTYGYAVPSRVTLNFSRLPYKEVLSFKMPGIQSWGKLERSFFEPNTGLQPTGIIDPRIGSSLIFDKYTGTFKFDHDNKLFKGLKEYSISTENAKHRVFSASTSKTGLYNIQKFLDTLLHTRKMRLYLKIDNLWYEYESPKTFGYFNVNQKQQYSGWPTVFQQTNLNTDSSFGPFIQSVPKVPLEYNYIKDQILTQEQQPLEPLWYGNNINEEESFDRYPYSRFKFLKDQDDNTKIYVRGTRLYFKINNIDKTKGIINQDYESVILQNDRTIRIISNEELIKYPNDIYNCSEVSGTRIDILGQTVSIWHKPEKQDDFIRDLNYINKKYIKMNCDMFVEHKINHNIMKDKWNNLYTVIHFENALASNIDQGYITIDSSFPAMDNLRSDLVLSATVNKMFVPPKEIVVINTTGLGVHSQFSNKWSDVAYLNNTIDILNNQTRYNTINNRHGPFLYDNMLNYIMANNYMSAHWHQNPLSPLEMIYEGELNLYIKNELSSTEDLFSNVVSYKKMKELSYYVHQPFSAGSDSRYDKTIDRYNVFKNTNPIIDMNILKNDSDAEIKIKGDIGILCISGINRPTFDSSTTYRESGDIRFWIDLDHNFLLTPVPFADTPFFSPTFSVGDTYASFDTVIARNTKVETSIPCQSVITANLSVPDMGNPGNFKWDHFQKRSKEGSIFSSYPIYCDYDPVEACGSRRRCSLPIVGYTNVSAVFSTYAPIYKTVADLPDTDIEYCLSVDNGIYCPVGCSSTTGGVMPYIVRSQLANYSLLFPNYTPNGTSQCVAGVSYPPMPKGLSVWDGIYQSEVENNLSSPKDIDHLANDIIYRALYGTTETINLQDISKEDKTIDKTDAGIIRSLMVSQDNINNIYTFIPLDYDVSAGVDESTLNAKRKVQGGINLYGPVVIGAEIKMSIGDIELIFKITETDEDIVITETTSQAAGVLLNKATKTTSTFLKERGSGGSSIIGAGTTERVVGSCTEISDFGVSAYCSTKPMGAVGGCSSSSVGGPYSYTEEVGVLPDPVCFMTNCFRSTNIMETSQSLAPGSPTATCGGLNFKEFSKSNMVGNLDSSLKKYGGGLAGYGGDSVAPSMCNGWAINTCSIPEDCSCDGNNGLPPPAEGDVVIVNQPGAGSAGYKYNVKNCLYDYTLSASLSNSRGGGGIVTPDSPSIGNMCVNKTIYTNLIPKNLWEVDIPMYCDCSQPDFLRRLSIGPPPSDGGGTPPPTEGQIVCGPGPNYTYPCDCCEMACEDPSPIISLPCRPCFKVWKYLPCNESYWMNVCKTPGKIWDVVETTTITEINNGPSIECRRLLANITWDNNQIVITPGIEKKDASNVIIYGADCIPNQINDCPSVSITLPSDQYAFTDAVSSSCESCSQNTDIVQVLANPEWMLQDDDNICILGTTIIGGSMNGDYTQGSCVAREDTEGEYNDPWMYQGCRACGSPWKYTLDPPPRVTTCYHHYIKPVGLGSEAPTPKHLCEYNIVGDGKAIDFPSWSTNGTATATYIELWKAKMTEIASKAYYCSNSYNFKLKDLVEGVIPGSCQLKFETVSWPIGAIRANYIRNLEECSIDVQIEEKDGAVAVMIAYLQYTYRTPLKIGDVLTDDYGKDVTSSQCRTYYNSGTGRAGDCRNGIFDGHFTNTGETYKSRKTKNGGCLANATCYDSIRPCGPTDYCCKHGK